MGRRTATLAIIMLLSIISMALAPLSGSAATMQVICGADGAQTIMVDAAGNPVDPADSCHCPTCTGCAMVGAAPPAPATSFTIPDISASRAAADNRVAQSCPQTGHARPVARGPPVGKGRCNV